MNNDFVLHLPNDVKHSQQYVINTAMRLIVGKKVVEMAETSEIKLSLFAHTPGKWQFYCKQIAGNIESTHESFFKWTQIINSYLSEIYITTDDTGYIIKVQVLNASSRWHDLQQQLRAKYSKNEGLEDMIRQIADFIHHEDNIVKQLNVAGFHKLFFNGYYGTYTIDEPVQQEDRIEKLVAGIDIPLLLTKELSLPDFPSESETCTLTIKGSLNEQAFDRKRLVRWLKDITDIYNLKVSHTLEMEEHYSYNKLHWLTSADSYFSFDTAGIYSYTLARTIGQKSNEQAPKSEDKLAYT